MRHRGKGAGDGGSREESHGGEWAAPPAALATANGSATREPRSAKPAHAPLSDTVFFGLPEYPWAPFFLFLVTCALHFYRIDEPAAVVFDEYHFGRFTNQYNKGTYLFDIHPPMGKLTLYFTGVLFGYDADHCSYDSIHKPYDRKLCKFLPLRIMASLFGCFTLPLLYSIIRRLGGRMEAAMFGCFLFMFDNLNLIESRLILIDSQLIFYCALALWFALVYWQRWRDHEDAVLIREYGNRFSTTAVHSDQELDAIAGGVLDGIEEDEKDSDDEDLGGSSQAATSTPSATSAAPARTGASGASDAPVYSERERMRIGLHRLDDMLHNGLGSLGFRVPIPVRSSTSLAVAEAVRSWSRPAATQRPRELTLTERLLWSVGLGLVCGAAVSIKWTALATPGMIAVECFFGFFFLRESIPILDLLVTAFSAFVVYAWNFWVHFKLLPYHGDGDAFMSLEFQRKIVNNTHYDPNAPELPFLTKLWQLNAEMLSANARIDTPHHWMSKWHSWPLNQRGVLYYSHTRPDGHSEVVYLLGNPAVIWFVGIAVLVGFVALFIYLRVRNEPDLRFPAGFRGFLNSIFYASITYLLNLLPYILVSRSAFVYHYMPALMYAEIMAALTMDWVMGKNVRSAMKIVSLIIFIVWLYFSPWVYSTALSADAHQRRRWLKTWD